MSSSATWGGRGPAPCARARADRAELEGRAGGAEEELDGHAVLVKLFDPAHIAARAGA